jgi:N-acetyl-alpha-D-glucosaminyl L-malate synthase BshA
VNLDTIEYNWEQKHDLKKIYAPNGEFILCHISNFRKVKRISDILKIFAIVRKEVPAKLLLVGDGPERMHIRNQCEELGICDDVVIMGKLKSPYEILSISDLFLLTSEKESFGLAALEAMAYSVPVISSNTGGIPEVNEQGYSGFLSDVGDVDDMAANALSLLKDKDKLEKFKRQARTKAEEFNIDKVLPLYINLYNKVLDDMK